MRTFIAIELPEEVKSEIFHAFEKLEKFNLIRGKFVEKENLHLTLKFLGEISQEKYLEIEKKLLEINISKFNFKIGEVGVFPGENHVKVIWVDLICENEELLNLVKNIEDKLEKFGIPKENRDFQSHVTAARVYVVKNRKLFLEKLEKIHITKMDFEINNFSIIKSELMKEGPVYKTLKKFPLK